MEGKLSNSLPLELLVLDMHSSLRREAGSSRSSLVLKKEARLVAGEETCANLHGRVILILMKVGISTSTWFQVVPFYSLISEQILFSLSDDFLRRL